MKDLYAIKDVGTLVLKNKNEDIELNFVSDVEVVKINEARILLLTTQLTNDYLENSILENGGICDFTHHIKIRRHSDGNDFEKMKIYTGMQLVRAEKIMSYENVTKFLYVFTDGEHNIMSHIDKCIDRKIQREHIDRMEYVSYNIKKSINDLTLQTERNTQEIVYRCLSEVAKRLNGGK